jgi:hypothetical protein
MAVNVVNEIDETAQSSFDLIQLGMVVIARVFNLMLANKALIILITILVLGGGKLEAMLGKAKAKIG